MEIDTDQKDDDIHDSGSYGSLSIIIPLDLDHRSQAEFYDTLGISLPIYLPRYHSGRVARHENLKKI